SQKVIFSSRLPASLMGGGRGRGPISLSGGGRGATRWRGEHKEEGRGRPWGCGSLGRHPRERTRNDDGGLEEEGAACRGRPVSSGRCELRDNGGRAGRSRRRCRRLPACT